MARTGGKQTILDGECTTMVMRRGMMGGRRRGYPRPRNVIRTAKYIVVVGPASEATGTTVTPMILGADNAVLGQTGVTDITVPVGARVEKIEIFMPKIGLGAIGNFITWSVQHLVSGQAVISPIVAGGSPLRKNIILTGHVGLGQNQNNSIHVKFRIPKRFQRIGDGDAFQIVNHNHLAVTTDYYIIYTVIM